MKKKFMAGILATFLVIGQIISVPLTSFAQTEDVDAKLQEIESALEALEDEAKELDPKSGKKAGTTYESVDESTGITWKYVTNSDGDIIKLWTETADISGAIADGVLIIPGSVDSLTVKGIGGDTEEKPVVPAGASYTSVSIPVTTTVINDYAFNGNTSLTNLVVPSSVSTIEAMAFKDITSLTTVEIKGTAEIGVSAFEGTGITSLTLSAGSATKSGRICNSAFKDVAGLATLYIPPYTTLESSAFKNCTGLIKLQTGSSLTERSFEGCNQISTVILDDTCEQIAYGWDGESGGPASRTIYVKNPNTKALMHKDTLGTSIISPFGLTGNVNVIYDSTGHSSIIPFSVTAPLGGELASATGVQGDIIALAALTSPDNDAELAWVKGTATSVTFNDSTLALAGAEDLKPAQAELTAERSVALKVNRKLVKSNVTVKKNGITLSPEDFYVMRKSVYDAITEKTEENVSECDVLAALASDLNGASGIIKAVAVTFNEGTPLVAEFDIRVEGEATEDYILKDGIEAASQKVSTMSENSVALASNIEELDETLDDMIQAIDDEIEANGSTEALQTARGELVSMKETLADYRDRLSDVAQQIENAEDVIEENSIDIGSTTITLSTNEVKKNSDGSIPYPEYTVKYNGESLVENKDFTTAKSYNKNENKGKITFTGTGIYKGSTEKTFDVALAGELIVDTSDFVGAGGALGGRTDLRIDNGLASIREILKNAAEGPVDEDASLNPVTEDVYVSMSVGSPTASDRAKLDAKMEEMTSEDKTYKVVSSFDINITAEDEGGNEVEISDLGATSLNFTADVPTQYQDAEKYSYGILRIHKGVVQDITESATKNKTNGKVTSISFPNSLFSTFAVYIGSTGNTIDPGDFTATIPKTSYAYTGSAIKPAVTVKYDGNTLTENVDYKLTYKNNTSQGLATITVQGLDSSADASSAYPEDYSGCSLDINFAITEGSKKSGDISNVVSIISGANSFTYTGKAITPAVLVMDNGELMAQGTDYTLYYQDNVDAGTGSVIVQGINDYIGYRAEHTFTINEKDIGSSGVSISDIDDDVEIDEGDTATQKVKIKYNGMTLSKGKDYTVSYTNNKKDGTATITIEGQGNYTGSVEEDFKVKVRSSKSSSSSSMWSNSSSMYGIGGTPNSMIPTGASGVAGAAAAGSGASPKTNDISTVPIWIGILLLAFGGLGVLWLKKRRS